MFLSIVHILHDDRLFNLIFNLQRRCSNSPRHLINFLPFLLYLLIACMLSGCSQATQAVKPAAMQSIRVVMDNNYPPYTFLDNNGSLQGIIIDQWRLWEKKTGIKVEISAMDWGTALQRMEAGEFDVIDTLFYNDTRAKIYDFSRAYARLDVPIFFLQSISGITDASSLEGFPVAVKRGDAAIDFLRSQGVDQILEYPSYEAIIQAARDKHVIVFVVDKPPALYYLYKLGIYNQFNQSQPLYSGEFHRAVLKGNAQILQTVEQGFAMISQQEYDAIDEVWLGQRTIDPLIWQWIRIVGGGIALLLILLLVWSYSLRRTVGKRTADLNQAMLDVSASEMKYRQLVANVPGVVFRCANDANWTILYISAGVTDLLGYPATDFLNKPVSDLLRLVRGKDPKSLLRSIQQDLQNSGMFTADFPITTAAGRVLWVTTRGQAVINPEGEMQWVDGLALDITERTRAETALRESEANLHSLEKEARRMSELMASLTHISMSLSLAQTTDDLFRMAVEASIRQLGFDRMGIWLLDDSNPGFAYGTFGVDEAGNIRDERHRYHKMDPAFMEREMVWGKLPVINSPQVELMNDTKDCIGVGDVAAVPLWDGHSVKGHIFVDNLIHHQPIDPQQREALSLFAQVVGQLYSIKKGEEAVRGLNAELEQRVQQRTAQLEASYAEMQSFSYSISHDLRAPLRSLNSFSQFMEEEYGNSLDEQGRDYLRRIRAAGTHLTDLIDALLKLARISRSEIQMVDVSLGRLAQEIAESLTATQPERKVTWLIDSDMHCTADPTLIRVVLENLLGNAWKFTSRHATARIELGKNTEKGETVFYVRDDGAGFNMQYANQLFGTFQRLHLYSEFEGTGIGLAIVQRIVQRHHGRIWAESAVDQGTTFYFTLGDGIGT